MSETVDSHCHVSARWYEPVETLLFQMDRCEVGRAVLIQLLGGTDNAAMRDACAQNVGRFAWVAGLDHLAANWRQNLADLVSAGASGLRLRAACRTPGEDPLALWRAAEETGMRISVAGRVSELTNGDLAEVAAACPDLPLVLEHLGGLGRPDRDELAQALPAVCALAAHSNISLKLPGLGQLAPRLPSPDGTDRPLNVAVAGVEEVLSQLMDSFGPDRFMWGSDFPPVAAREGYRNALVWSRDFIASRWPEAVENVFGRNAMRIWFGS